MRIWDINPSLLCREHLLGEHRELHAIWSILTEDRAGYARHPETLRWVGKLGALYDRHEAQVQEMLRRGYRHQSPLDPARASGSRHQDTCLDPINRQIELLRSKPCRCFQADESVPIQSTK